MFRWLGLGSAEKITQDAEVEFDIWVTEKIEYCVFRAIALEIFLHHDVEVGRN